MLQKKRQQDYLKKHVEAMLVHFLAFCESGSAEDIHRFRVEFKKVEALVWFARKCTRNAELKRMIQPAKKIFHRAGIIRNGQVNTVIMEKFHFTGQFCEEQKILVCEETGKFRAHERQYKAVIQDLYDRVSAALTDIPSKKALRKYREELEKLSVIFSGPQSETSLHNARRKLKRALYVHAIIRKISDKKPGMNINYLHDLQQKIGEWHDAASTFLLLRSSTAAGEKITKIIREQKNRLFSETVLLAGEFEKKLFAEKNAV